MRHRFLRLIGPIVLAGAALALAGSQPNTPALRCTLTDKKIETCCCAEKDGKLYCPLANKTIEKCCCVPAGKAR